jgi:Ni/Co efflux regulator RcnB
MRKTILTILATAVLAASSVQFAAAAEHHRARKVVRAPAPVSEPFRNPSVYDSNAYYGASPYTSDYSRYQNGAMSAPAGQ